MRAIADALSSSNFDIIAIQELWVKKDYILLKERLENLYPFSHRFHSGIVGSGLAVFSKHEFIKLNFYPYRLNGNPLFVLHGDWYAGKGVGHVRIKHANSIIDFFVTHMIANYHSKKDGMDMYSVQRCMQMVEFCNFINSSRIVDSVVIAAGDLNMDDKDTMFKEIIGNGLFVDSDTLRLRSVWDDFRGFSRSTFNRESNLYHNPIKDEECIDYIMYDPSKSSCEEVSLYLTGNIDKSGISYSDHCGVVASFSLGDQFIDQHVQRPSLGNYYYSKAGSYVSLLQGRQSLLQMIVTISFGLCVALFFLICTSDPAKGHGIHIFRMLLIFALISLLFPAILYGKLWYNYEINQVNEAMSEWLVWLRQRI